MSKKIIEFKDLYKNFKMKKTHLKTNYMKIKKLKIKIC